MLSFLYMLFTGVLGVLVAGSVAYLLLLLAAALLALRERRSVKADLHPTAGDELRPLRTVVVIPAHNEEWVLGATLDSLNDQDYPRDRYQVVVVADNCSDGTVAVAATYGARVLERQDVSRRGKGYALEWAFARLLAEPESADAFVIIDADTWVAPDFLTCMTAQLAAKQDARGCCALQGRYGVLNGKEGWRAALMAAAFDLHNHVKPLGWDRLGLTVGLKGNGMAFTRAVLERAPWQGHSITEDIDYGLDLLYHHGIRVRYVPHAEVRAQMPVTAAQGASQRERWERGRYRLLRQRVWPLAQAALIRRDLRLADSACALIVPPLAELAGMLLLLAVMVVVGRIANLLPIPNVWAGALILTILGLCTYVTGGLLVSGAPISAFAALLWAPWYALWKFGLYTLSLLRTSSRPGAAEWVRTERAPVSIHPVPAPADDVSP